MTNPPENWEERLVKLGNLHPKNMGFACDIRELKSLIRTLISEAKEKEQEKLVGIMCESCRSKV